MHGMHPQANGLPKFTPNLCTFWWLVIATRLLSELKHAKCTCHSFAYIKKGMYNVKLIIYLYANGAVMMYPSFFLNHFG